MGAFTRVAFLLVTLAVALAPAENLTCSQAATPAAYKLYPAGTVFKQRSALVGRFSTFYNKSGIRLDMTEKDIVIYMRRPDWLVVMYNTRKKLYFQSSLADWRPGTSINGNLVRTDDPSALTVASNVKEAINGLDTRKFILVGPSYINSKNTFERLQIKEGQTWCLDDKTVPKDVFYKIDDLLAVPQTNGLLLQMRMVNNKGTKKTEIGLFAVEDGSKFGGGPASVFTLPKGYKRVNKQEELLLHNSTQEVLNDFFR